MPTSSKAGIEGMELPLEQHPKDDIWVSEWEARFKKERTKFYDFTREIDSILSKNIKEQKTDVFAIEARTKSVQSFSEKIARDDKDYKNPLSEITDLSGCRVITFYNTDIDLIEGIVRENFSVDEANSPKKDAKDKPNEFGYLSYSPMFGQISA